MFNGMRIRDWQALGLLPVSDFWRNRATWARSRSRLRLGEDRFYKYIRAFGFGQQTGIELPGETRGMTKPLSRWSKVSIGGHLDGAGNWHLRRCNLRSMVIDALRMTECCSPPRIVAGDDSPQRLLRRRLLFIPAEGTAGTSRLQSAALMRQMMQGVVLHGTGKKAMLEGYSSGGKTGTAQKFDPASTLIRTPNIGRRSPDLLPSTTRRLRWR